MTTTVHMTAALMSALVPLFAPPSPPSCVAKLISAESGAHAHLPAPILTPEGGVAGTRVAIRGSGFPPGTQLTIAGVYGENGCVIEGLGDQYLGSTRADDRGAYAVMIRWPARFDPVLGRNRTAPDLLPRGRYYVFALPCSSRAACSFTQGTLPGGPFELGKARASPGGLIVLWLAIAGALLGGIAMIRLRSR